jgi:hypothetical protein
MKAVTFDTLRFARTLREKAKLSSEQAEGLADAIAEAFQGDVATKTDVTSVRSDLREAELRLEAKIEATKADIIRWMSGTIGFQTLIILGAVIALAWIVR